MGVYPLYEVVDLISIQLELVLRYRCIHPLFLTHASKQHLDYSSVGCDYELMDVRVRGLFVAADYNINFVV